MQYAYWRAGSQTIFLACKFRATSREVVQVGGPLRVRALL